MTRHHLHACALRCLFVVIAFALMVPAAACAEPAAEHSVKLFIGQDLGSIRGYFNSKCCQTPDGVTTYVDFYNILVPDKAYGGLGIDESGHPVTANGDWGGGPANAFVGATEFGVKMLAIGLDISDTIHPGGMSELIAGKRDREIDQLAIYFKQIPITVALRIGYEFDGPWNRGYENKKDYITAFRRVVDRLRVAGVTNVLYVWQGAATPIVQMIHGGYLDSIADWYPGDDYVDWVALSWFLPPDARSDVKLPNGTPQILSPSYFTAQVLDFTRAHGKKLMIAESSPQGYDLARLTHRDIGYWDGHPGEHQRSVTADEIWDDWYVPYLSFIRKNRADIAAVAYINCDWDVQEMWRAPYPQGYWGDTRIEANPIIMNHWMAELKAGL